MPFPLLFFAQMIVQIAGMWYNYHVISKYFGICRSEGGARHDMDSRCAV